MKFTAFLPAIAWGLLIIVLLCLPGSTLPRNPFLQAIHADKWVHVALFGILSWLAARPVRQSQPADTAKRSWYTGIALSGILLGIALEFVQLYWVANRSFETADIFADSAGAIAGVIIIWKQGRKRSG